MLKEQLGKNGKMGLTCPGSMSIKQPIPEFLFCPNCGAEVEVWTNERMRNCSSCGTPVIREMDGASCVQWCKQARECVGEEKYEELFRTGILSNEKDEEVRIPEKLKEFMRECGVPIPGEDA